jgi:pimeloyl-ACP methyl ester carboxylesterase
MDLEAVRAALGYPQIDFYGGSYGGVDAQAYAARFPDRVHALVLDSTFPVNDADHVAWSGGSFGATALVHVVALQCQRTPSCASLSDEPETLLLETVAQLRDHPIDGTSTNASAKPVHLDDLAMAAVLALVDPYLTVSAAKALAGGDSKRLINLAADHVQFAPFDDQDSVVPFSWGANLAGWCNDQVVPWSQTDSIPARKAAYDAYLAGLAPDAFAPFSVSSWSIWNYMDQCLEWPAPVNFTPVIPAGTTMPDVPTLILGGDEDNGVPLGFSRALLELFPQATFVQVAGAGHPTMSMDGQCVPSIVGGFLETGTVPDTSCAGTPG